MEGGRATAAGVLCLIIGAACRPMQRMEPNPLIGLRTPWTLKSDRSWVALLTWYSYVQWRDDPDRG